MHAIDEFMEHLNEEISSNKVNMENCCIVIKSGSHGIFQTQGIFKTVEDFKSRGAGIYDYIDDMFDKIIELYEFD